MDHGLGLYLYANRRAPANVHNISVNSMHLIRSGPRPEAFVTFLATARLGGIWLGLNPAHTVGPGAGAGEA